MFIIYYFELHLIHKNVYYNYKEYAAELQDSKSHKSMLQTNSNET